ncbi:sulfurtransferase complex subunit TusB [Marinobacter sp. chi1]|uniref:Sulfurtransferase complex subunit TusB n=2 Tax=Marinobacter TaxID=2742 RepID=A0ABT8W219_9GAMM|nr:sulfurtransferase complex subunit TusB [Marinobacter sp. chi1]MBZ2167976.1 sulfurtransferase complex subunit TusB [Marinobacter sp. F4216]MDO3722293.1 sulfurtransferase complex subunit TusB [Marinobacter sp. chi1]
MSQIHTLHILNKTPEHPRFNECLAMMGPDDALVLTENGVTALWSTSKAALPKVFATKADLQARGLVAEANGATSVDYPELVDLTVQAKRVISW